MRYSSVQANQSFKMKEITVCFSAERKQLLREMATRSEQIASGNLAVRRLSSQEDLFGISSGPLGCSDIRSIENIAKNTLFTTGYIIIFNNGIVVFQTCG